MASNDAKQSEKTAGVTATATELRSPVEANEGAVIIERSLKKAIWTIVCGVALPCIPILIITCVLLYMIFHNELHINPGWPALQPPTTASHNNATSLVHMIHQEGGTPAYYVQANPSTITTIAGWTSRVIPYLSSSIMALVAFFAARHIVAKSKGGDGSGLPNPDQLAILIALLGGNSFGPLYDAMVYRFYSKGRLIHPLPAAFSALAIITTLGLIIPILDTWFGVATKAVVVTQIYPVATAVQTFGKEVSTANCTNGPNANSATAYTSNLDGIQIDQSAFWSCNQYLDTEAHDLFFVGMSEGTRIASDTSTISKVENYTDKAGTTYYYLVDPSQSSTFDYQTTTFAVSSQCRPMTHECGLYSATEHSGGQDQLFTCSPAFTGSVTESYLDPGATSLNTTIVSPTFGIAFAQDAALAVAGRSLQLSYTADDSTTIDLSYPEVYTTNPLYYGFWASGYPPKDVDEEISIHGNDTGVVTADIGGVWMLNCSTTVYDVKYTWVNGAVMTFETKESSTDFSAMLSAPFAASVNSSESMLILESIALVTGVTYNSTDLASRFQRDFSRKLLAYAFRAIDPTVNSFEQIRNATIPVARIPMIPLYLLLGTKALYVVAVIVLATAAYCFTHPAETEIVKAQLSVKGLTMAHFEKADTRQQEVVQALQERIDAAKGKEPEKSNTEAVEIGPVETAEPTKQQAIRRAMTAPVTQPGQTVWTGPIVPFHSKPEVTMASSTATTAAGATASAAAVAEQTKIGLLPDLTGKWRYVTFADGVWNSVKPIVETLVVADSKDGGLGSVGGFVKAWH